MTDRPPKHDPDRFDDLIHAACDRTLDESGLRELEAILSSDDSAAKKYVETVQVWAELLECADLLAPDEDHQKNGILARNGVDTQPTKRRVGGWTGYAAMAATLLLAFSLGVFYGKGLPGSDSHGRRTASPERENPAPMALSRLTGRYVARVVDVTDDATWGDAMPREFLLRLTEGEPLDLRSGIAQVQFASGASVLLHGPSRFTAVAGDTGRLVSGRVTGRAENGNFKLLTQLAEVVDLGTEFGVSTDDDSFVDVCVFDGEVDVNATGGAGRTQDGGAMRLTEGMAVRVESDGKIDETAEVVRHEFTRHQARELRAKNGEHVSLVDVVAGGDGRSDWIAGAIDPRTGDWDAEISLDPEAGRDRYADGKYKTFQGSPLIDGVFIPSATGVDTQIDSTQRSFSFAKNDGKTWGPIWCRRHVPRLPVGVGESNDYWGTQTQEGILNLLQESREGIIGMHSNVGLTIDLRAVRMLEGRPVSRFRTTIANLDNSTSRPPELSVDYMPTVDFCVFVDGELRYERRDLGRDHGKSDVDIVVGPTDRFLTIVSTDSGDSFSFDHLVLIDPKLLIEKPL